MVQFDKAGRSKYTYVFSHALYSRCLFTDDHCPPARFLADRGIMGLGKVSVCVTDYWDCLGSAEMADKVEVVIIL